jgi:hypothetical protein
MFRVDTPISPTQIFSPSVIGICETLMSGISPIDANRWRIVFAAKCALILLAV